MTFRQINRDEMLRAPEWMGYRRILERPDGFVRESAGIYASSPTSRSNTGKVYTPAEDRIIHVLGKIGCPTAQIAEYLPNRTPGSIADRIRRLGSKERKALKRVADHLVRAALENAK